MNSNFLIEYKRERDRRANKKHIIENTVKQIQNIDLLNTSVSELYNSINNIQQNLKNM